MPTQDTNLIIIKHVDTAHPYLDHLSSAWSRQCDAPARIDAAATAERVEAAHLKAHLSVSVRRVIVAKHSQRPQDGDTWRVHGHQDHGLLLVGGRARVGLAHEDADLAAGVHRTARPPLEACQHIAVSVPVQAHIA